MVNPPEKDLHLITAVADQGQGGLKGKTQSNSTAQSSIALTKDNPAITTPKRSSKQNPSETAKDGAMNGHSLFPSEVAQGQDVPTANTRPNLTTPLSIDFTKDNPDPTTSKSQRKQPPPYKTAEHGAVQGQSLVSYITKLKVSTFHRLYKKAWRQEVFSLATAQRVITTDKKSALLLGIFAHVRPDINCPAIIPPIVEAFERLKRKAKIAKAQSKIKKRLASTPANPKGGKAHDSPKRLNPCNATMDFVEIVWHALTTAFPTTIAHSLDRFSIGWSTKQGWSQNKIFNYVHTTTILFYDVCAAHQKWPPTMGSNEAKSQEVALKLTRTAPEHAQEGLEATTRSNSTTLLTVDIVKKTPNACISSMLYSLFVLFLSLEKIQPTKFLVLHFQIPTIRVGAPTFPLTGLARKNCIQFFP
ncbi:unnamed protein product [Cylindrotheca closterium]|uniref:Uncharacterized protein n=1 Tax=Cylindrotheca closterium TaxID=2856 RepID=A0AAD2JGG7_9STRA|nr:unnamed protein product [Cylindrotheca closterium]